MEDLGVTSRMDGTFWLDRPVFVTGATGLLGSWLVKALARLGTDTVCLVRDWVPQSEFVRSHAIDRCKVVRGDVRDQSTLERLLGEYEIDTVFHLAAQTIVPIANRNPISTFESNVRGTWALLEACRRSPAVRQVIVASSDKAYGSHEPLPYTEETPLAGSHPYDASKACAELIGRSYARTFGVPVAITRCGNLFGGGDLNWNRIVPGTIRAVIRGQRPVIRSDGRYVRDYFYVEDAAAAVILLAEKLSAERSLVGEAFNLSYERPLSVLQMADFILSMMKSDLRPEIRNEASGEIREQYLDARKARTVIGWEPHFTIEQGLVSTIEWYRDFFGEAV